MPEDIIRFLGLIKLLKGDYLVLTYPQLFQKLIQRPQASTEELVNSQIGFIIAELPNLALLSCILATFTPKNQGKYLECPDPSIISEREFTHIVENSPDLTRHTLTVNKLEALIMLLSSTHQDALIAICDDLGINLDNLTYLKTADPKQYSTAQQKAGEWLAKNNLFWLLADRQHHGKNNLFTPSELFVPNTLHHQCPAMTFTAAWYQGLGQSLRENKDHVLELISNEARKS